MARGLALGVNEYLVKLDQTQLLESLDRAVSGDRRGTPVMA